MRIPLPAKVFISYLAVIAAGSLPSIYYVTTTLEDQVVATQTTEASARVTRIAKRLGPMTDEARLEELRRIGYATPERLTLIRRDGTVVFDSQVRDLQTLDDHSTRPEVIAALAPAGEGEPATHISSSVRHSDTLELDTLFVAAPIRSSTDSSEVSVLRLSKPLRQTAAFSDRALSSFLNSQAIALSIAMIFSLLAVFAFVRPMRRLTATSQKLSDGDFTASMSDKRDDEIGDVARSLEKLGLEMRQRLANAQSGRVLLSQLVEAVPYAVCVVDPTRHVIAINAPGRELMSAYGRDGNAVIKNFFASEEILAAIAKSRGRSDSIRIGDSDMRVIALEHPGSDPYVALFSTGSGHRARISLLPEPEEIEPVRLDDLVARAVTGTHLQMPELRIPDELIHVAAAEAGGRLASAVRLALLEVGCEKIKIRTGDGVLGLKFSKINDLECAEGVRDLVTPLGGRLQTTTKGAILWLPLA